MKKLTDSVALLFLSTLIAGSGLLFITVHAQWGGSTAADNTSNITIAQTGTAFCGNGILEGTEECDGALLRDKTCSFFGFSGGTLSCTDSCHFNTNLCTNNTTSTSGNTTNTNSTPNTNDSSAVCGNMLIEGSEQCDGTNLHDKTCKDFNFSSGTLLCSAQCTFNTAGCLTASTDTSSTNQNTNTSDTTLVQPLPTAPVCGNGKAEEFEECDTADLRGLSCQSLGLPAGTLSCSSLCRLDKTRCSTTTLTTEVVCGNGVAEINEECDGTDLRQKSCAQFGRTGTLRCANCRFDTASCSTVPTENTEITTAVCNNNKAEAGEECDGTDLRGLSCQSLGAAGGTLACGSDCRINKSGCTTAVSTPTATSGESAPTAVVPVPERCQKLGITDLTKCDAVFSLDFPQVCRDANILDTMACEEFIRKQVTDKSCENAGITSEGCPDTLLTKYQDRLYCGSFSTEECRVMVKNQLVGQVAVAAEEQASITRAINEKIGNHATIKELTEALEQGHATGGLIPLKIDTSRTLLVQPSFGTIDVSSGVTARATIPYAIMTDDDGDGLSNDLEAIYGTNPKNSDSDNDGYSDTEEIKNGYDPLSPAPGKTERELSPVEHALINYTRIEQPVSSGTTSPAFAISRVENSEQDTGYSLHGKATPNSIVLIYVYSEMPLVLTVKTDADGNWSYIVTDDLTDGKHTAYVAVVDDYGKVTEKSNPLSFFVRQARAATLEEFLNSETRVEIETKSNSLLRYYIISGIGVICIALGLFGFMLFRRQRQSSHV